MNQGLNINHSIYIKIQSNLEFVKKAETCGTADQTKNSGTQFSFPCDICISPKVQTSKIYGVKSFVCNSNSLLFFSNFLMELSFRL